MGGVNNFVWLWKNSRGIRARILFSALAGILRVACGLGFIYISKELIDMATGTVQGVLSQYVVWMVLLVLGGIVCNSVAGWMTGLMEVKVQNILRQRLFEGVLQSRWTGREPFHSGDVQSRLGADIHNVVSLLAVSVPSLVVTGSQLLGSFFFLDRLDGTLARILVSGMLVFLFFGKIYAKRMRRLTHGVRSGESAVQSLTQESVQYRMVIKTLEGAGLMGMRLAELQSVLYSRVKCRTCFSVFSRMLLSSGFTGGYLLAFTWGVFQLQEGAITFGVMTAFLQLVGQIQRPILDLTRLVPTLTSALASMDRLRELEALVPEEQGEPILLSGVVGLKLSGVCFGYDDRPVLEGFSYDFVPGSVTAVLGATGAGKTTLVRLMLALVRPQNGNVTLYSSQGESESSALTRGNFVYVPQGNTLFSGTIRENLLLGNPAAGEPQIRNALYSAAAEFVYTLPQGLDTRCGEQGSGLSEGQSQRLAIARSLLRSGTVLLLDEVSSALDTATEKLLLRRLMRHCKGRTVIFITHREDITKGCDKLVLRSDPF